MRPRRDITERPEFVKGETVRCIDVGPYADGRLTKNKLYEIIRTYREDGAYMCRVVCDKRYTISVYSARFERTTLSNAERIAKRKAEVAG